MTELSARERGSIVREYLADSHPEALTFDGLDHALVGIGSQYPGPPLAVYDRGRIVAALEKQGMTYEDAVEWLDVNIADLYAGPGTPLILDPVEEM